MHCGRLTAATCTMTASKARGQHTCRCGRVQNGDAGRAARSEAGDDRVRLRLPRDLDQHRQALVQRVLLARPAAPQGACFIPSFYTLFQVFCTNFNTNLFCRSLMFKFLTQVFDSRPLCRIPISNSLYSL